MSAEDPPNLSASGGPPGPGGPQITSPMPGPPPPQMGPPMPPGPPGMMTSHQPGPGPQGMPMGSMQPHGPMSGSMVPGQPPVPHHNAHPSSQPPQPNQQGYPPDNLHMLQRVCHSKLTLFNSRNPFYPPFNHYTGIHFPIFWVFYSFILSFKYFN